MIIQDKGAAARRLLNAASLMALVAGASLVASAASAQTASTQAAPAGEDLSEVVVTGSRIAGFSSPTPVTSVSAADLKVQAIQNVSQLLTRIPQLRINQNIGNSSQPIGASNLDLRGLGPTRTLVLIDGRRVAATDPTGGIDVNGIPASLISGIDIVTGGASAAYGSDAVSGVVNITLEKNLQGFKGDISYGQSTYNDMERPGVSLAWGTKFADDRGHFVIAGDYSNNQGQLRQASRPWGRNKTSILTNPGFTTTNGQTRQVIVDNAVFSQMTDGGVIAAPVGSPLRGIQFGPGGVTQPFLYGNYIGAVYMQGGSGGSLEDDGNILPKIRRQSVYSRASFDVASNVTAWAEGLYTDTKVFSDLAPNYDNGTLTIQRDNAYLPANVRAIMLANNITSFNMGRIEREDGNSLFNNRGKSFRPAVGLTGTIADWNWNVSGQWTRNKYRSTSDNNRIQTNFFNAVDAVVNPATGQVVCRSTLTNPSNGCVPTNVFGPNVINPGALAYYRGTSWYEGRQEQDVYAADISGKPFSTWAGPVSLAVGAEYRREEISQTSDPISQVSGWRSINNKPLSGSFNVKEGFAEVVVPLAKDQPWAQSLELNGAVRYTDYSTSGGVTTWKAGINYIPVSDLRLRATASKDIRAANVNELFSGTNQVINPVVDPRDNVSRQTLQLTGGNPDLTPEKSDTYEVGAVYSPSWFSGFRVSLDYYSIDIKDVITSLSGQQIADGCLKAGKTDLCALISRNPTSGIITSITARLFNANELKTSGLDLEAQYKVPVDRFFANVNGDLTFRLLTNYVKELITVQNGISTDNLYNIGIGPGPPAGVPRWRSNFSAGYDNGPLNVTAFVRYIGGGNFNNAFVEGVDIPNNTVEHRTYLDLAASYQLKPSLQVYAKVDNAFNTDPPITPNAIIQPSVANSVFYDQFGRYYTVGLRFNY